MSPVKFSPLAQAVTSLEGNKGCNQEGVQPWHAHGMAMAMATGMALGPWGWTPEVHTIFEILSLDPEVHTIFEILNLDPRSAYYF